MRISEETQCSLPRGQFLAAGPSINRNHQSAFCKEGAPGAANRNVRCLQPEE
jgi:hypothetical protein